MVFTTRRGGHSAGPYASLNLGFASDDDPIAMQCNRAELPNVIGSPALSFTYQVHGTQVHRISAERPTDNVRPRPDDERPRADGERPLADDTRRRADDVRPRADGQATNRRDVAVAALVADCLPIAVAGRGAVAMLHAGWRGLQAGVIAAGVRAVRELGAEGELQAAIGPGAGPCCYEVGPKVHEAFADHENVRRGDNADLKEVARQQLVRAGVGAVHDIGLCTLCAPPGLLYSHRRDGGFTGRQAGVAWWR